MNDLGDNPRNMSGPAIIDNLIATAVRGDGRADAGSIDVQVLLQRAEFHGVGSLLFSRASGLAHWPPEPPDQHGERQREPAGR